MSATKATPLVLGGKEHSLRFTNRALVSLEDQTGKTIAQHAVLLSAGSLRSTSQLIWAGLLHEESHPTIDEVIDLVEIERVKEIATLLGAALEAAIGSEKEEQKQGNPQAAG